MVQCEKLKLLLHSISLGVCIYILSASKANHANASEHIGGVVHFAASAQV